MCGVRVTEGLGNNARTTFRMEPLPFSVEWHSLWAAASRGTGPTTSSGSLPTVSPGAWGTRTHCASRSQSVSALATADWRRFGTSTPAWRGGNRGPTRSRDVELSIQYPATLTSIWRECERAHRVVMYEPKSLDPPV